MLERIQVIQAHPAVSLSAGSAVSMRSQLGGGEEAWGSTPPTPLFQYVVSLRCIFHSRQAGFSSGNSASGNLLLAICFWQSASGNLLLAICFRHPSAAFSATRQRIRRKQQTHPHVRSAPRSDVPIPGNVTVMAPSSVICRSHR